MQINSSNLNFLFQEWDQKFQGAFEQAPVFWDRYSTLMPSSTDQSVHSWLEEQSGLHEWVGARQIDNVVARDYTLRNKDWEKTIGLDRNKVKDDTYGVFGPAVAQLGVQAKQWPDDVMTAVLEAGTTETGWDGEYFFDTDHPVDFDDSTKGTFSNLKVGSTWNLETDPIAVYKAIRKLGMKYKASNGRPLNVMFDTLMVPPDLEDAGLMLVKSDTRVQVVQNVAASQNVAAAGVTNIYQGALTLIVNPRLTVTDAYYFMETRRPVKPFIWQLRQAPEFASLFSPTDPNVFHMRKYLYGVDSRGAGGYTFPFLCVRGAAS